MPTREEIAEQVAKELGWKINGGGLVEFSDGQGGRTSPYPREARQLWDALISARVELAEREQGQCESCEDWKKNFLSCDRERKSAIERVKELSEALRRLIQSEGNPSNEDWEFAVKILPDAVVEDKP